LSNVGIRRCPLTRCPRHLPSEATEGPRTPKDGWDTVDATSGQVANVVELDDPAVVEVVVLAQQGDAPGREAEAHQNRRVDGQY
jgi:hypothetical protein